MKVNHHIDIELLCDALRYAYDQLENGVDEYEVLDAVEEKYNLTPWEQGWVLTSICELIDGPDEEEEEDEEEWKDKIRGGLADEADPDDFDSTSLAQGVEVEMEHTDDPEIAKEIAMDHLAEDPNYYSKLKKMESNPAWAVDHKIWEKAKKQVEPYWDKYDQPYAVVASVYRNMSGRVRSRKK